MASPYLPPMYDKQLENLAFKIDDLEETYESCRFSDCTFDDTNLSEITFEDCTFTRCSFKRCGFKNTRLQDIRFEECEFLDIDFQDSAAILRKMTFDRCRIELSGFRDGGFEGMVMRSCQLTEVDFEYARCSNGDWRGSRFQRCIFEQTDLEDCDLRETQGLRMRPDRNFLKGAKFDPDGLYGLLAHHGIVLEGG